MGRSRPRAVLVASGVVALLAVACQAIVGLDRFSKVECTKNCDASAPDADSGDILESGVPDSGLQPSDASLAKRWAQWRMPNPKDAEVDANRAVYGGSSFPIVDGGSPEQDGGAIEVIVDGVTNLTWAKGYSQKGLSYADANAYCDDLARATGRPFRLPTRIELVSLLDYTQPMFSMDPIFGLNESAVFWTQSVGLGQVAGSVWVVDFGKNGNADVLAPTANARARCVQ